LNKRLDENNQVKDGNYPISPTDAAAMTHDIEYRDAELLNNPEKLLEQKHVADSNIIGQLDNVPTINIRDKFANFLAKKALQLKLKLGMSIDPDLENLFIKGIEQSGGKLNPDLAKSLSGQLHKPIKHKFPRRKVIVYYKDEIFASDLIDFSKDPIIYRKAKYNYILVVIDCYTKYCWCYMIRHKTSDELINCYEQLFKIAKPEYIWFDMEKAVDSKKFKEFLEKNNVKLYHTYS